MPFMLALSLPAGCPILLDILDKILSLDQVTYLSVERTCTVYLDIRKKPPSSLDGPFHTYVMGLLCRAVERWHISGATPPRPRKSYLKVENIYTKHLPEVVCPTCRLRHIDHVNSWCLAKSVLTTPPRRLFPARLGPPWRQRHPWISFDNSPTHKKPPQ